MELSLRAGWTLVTGDSDSEVQEPDPQSSVHLQAATLNSPVVLSQRAVPCVVSLGVTLSLHDGRQVETHATGEPGSCWVSDQCGVSGCGGRHRKLSPGSQLCSFHWICSFQQDQVFVELSGVNLAWLNYKWLGGWLVDTIIGLPTSPPPPTVVCMCRRWQICVRLHKDVFLNCMTVQMAELSVVCRSLAYLFVFSQQMLRYNCVFLGGI